MGRAVINKSSSMRIAFGVLVGVMAIGCGAEPSSSDPDASVDRGEGGCLPDPDGGTTGDADADADVGTDSGEDGGKDAPLDIDPDRELQDCPIDMVPVGAVCVDVYEASRPDATAEEQGLAVGPAQSVAGVIPWHVALMTPEALVDFTDACEAAGKRMCQPSDWLAACEGPAGSAYVFGDAFDPKTCNCVDTFCEDWCTENGVAPESCVTGANCGYTYECFHVMPTGSFPACTNDLGTFDVTGNVWEVVPSTTDPRGFEVRGGAYNCAGAEARLSCTFNASWDQLFAGFRCCLDR
jgi:hypothetical protein